jgi:outer membrane protein assembly factor BamB
MVTLSSQAATGSHRSKPVLLAARLLLLGLLASLLVLGQRTPDAVAAASPMVSYPLFGFDPSRSSINPSEHALGAGSVAYLTRLWRISLPETVDSMAIELANVPGRSGRGTLFVTTLRGITLSLDASTGRVLWRVNGPRGARMAGYQITNATPAGDPSGQWIYAASPDGRIHKLRSADGREAPGWPVKVTLHAQDEKIGSALNLVGSTLLVGMGGYIGDFGHYQGKVVAIDTQTRALQVFNAMCSDKPVLLAEVSGNSPYCPAVRSAVWARAGAVVDSSPASPTRNMVFVATGNGDFDSRIYWGDSVLRLRLGATGLALVDAYTPVNQQALNDSDADLGSTAPIMLPRQPGPHPWLLLQGGKDAMLRLLDRANLGGHASPGRLGGELLTIPMPLGGGMFTAGLAINDRGLGTLIYVANGNGLAALRLSLSGNRYALRTLWSWRGQATSPVWANGVLYVAGSNLLRALDPLTGRTLWRSDASTAGGTIGGIHWQSPTVVNGMLFMPYADGALSAYGLRS